MSHGAPRFISKKTVTEREITVDFEMSRFIPGLDAHGIFFHINVQEHNTKNHFLCDIEWTNSVDSFWEWCMYTWLPVISCILDRSESVYGCPGCGLTFPQNSVLDTLQAVFQKLKEDFADFNTRARECAVATTLPTEPLPT